MNNQWGRSGNGQTSGGGGIGGILFAVVVSLALGGAGGYGAFRMMGGAAPAGEIETRDQRIADLARELDARVAQVEENSQKAQALTEENGTLKRQLDSLKNTTSASDGALAVAENSRLTRDVVPKLENDLELAGQRIADAEALKKRAEEAVLDRERRLSLQADQIARLEKALDEARDTRNTTQSAETERLEAEADTLRRELEEAQNAEEQLRAKDIPILQESIASKEREIATLNARNQALTERIEALEAAAAATKPGGQKDGGTKPALDNAKPATDGRSPRNAALVASAVRLMPGLDRLSSDQRDQLERTLVSGECVTTALGGVFKHIPALAMRNLMRDLDSGC
ncbi:hypothetical protein [Shinella sp. M31]|uniref:hypothetical protein n=1 Tax=Shinella sp. M31 TaxID=3368615 RepID=UPI003BA04B03